MVFGAAVTLALSAVVGCGGRSSRHVGGSGASGGTGGGGGTGGAGGSAGVPTGGTGNVLQPCGSSTVPVELLPAITVVLDGSEAMRAFSPSGQSYWDEARVMTLALLGTLRDGARLGVAVAHEIEDPGFGCLDAGFAVAPARLDTAQRRRIEALLDSIVPGEPSSLLLTYAATLDGLESSELAPARTSVVVLGSGLPGRDLTCSPIDTASLSLEYERLGTTARGHGIETFAVGLAGSPEERRLLSSLAIAGGTAPATCDLVKPTSCYHDVSERADPDLALANALREVALRSSAVCTFSLDGIPSDRVLDPDRVDFALARGADETFLERVEPGACESGWYLSDDGNDVTLCSGTCETIRNDPSTTLEIMFACDGPPPRN